VTAAVATPITLRRIVLHDLRCHARLAWQCETGVNVLLGGNGAGKTTVLEGVCLMSWGRSFRQARDPYLVRHGAEAFCVRGEWMRYGPMTLSVQGRRGELRVCLQGHQVRQRRRLSASFPVVVLAPQGGRLVDGQPNERRRWLNALAGVMRSSFTAQYQQYLRAVMQRNRLLRQGAGDALLDGWEQTIVEYGLQVASLRAQLVNELNELLRNDPLIEGEMRIDLAQQDLEAHSWLSLLRDKRAVDARMGGMRHGPHAQRVSLLFRGREIRLSGSRGQQKLAAVALKMAECALWSRYRGLRPLLLLDDALEALDAARQQRLMDVLLQYEGQVMLTAPQLAHPLSSSVNVYPVRALRQDPGQVDRNREMEEAA